MTSKYDAVIQKLVSAADSTHDPALKSLLEDGVQAIRDAVQDIQLDRRAIRVYIDSAVNILGIGGLDESNPHVDSAKKILWSGVSALDKTAPE